MDRQTALDKLELLRPDANAFQDPDFAEALAYLETDESARAVFARRQEQDRQIAIAVQDVPIPEGLQERLLQSIDEQESADSNRVAGKPAPPKMARRRWLISALIVMASCLLAALGLWLFQPPAPELLTLEELELTAPYGEQEFSQLDAFEGDFEPAIPGNLWRSERRFTFSSPKGFSPDRKGRDRVAAYEFFFRDPQKKHAGKLRGVMLVVPASELQSVPESTSFYGTSYKTVRTQPHVAIRSWKEKDLVYICLAPIQHDEALGNALDSTLS